MVVGRNFENVAHKSSSDHDGKVTPEEVADATMYLNDTIKKEEIEVLIGNLSKDSDGKILVEDIVKLATQPHADSACRAEARG
ncbi:hypothetical protein ACLOJK_008905 [Asimina triloba]